MMVYKIRFILSSLIAFQYSSKVRVVQVSTKIKLCPSVNEEVNEHFILSVSKILP